MCKQDKFFETDENFCRIFYFNLILFNMRAISVIFYKDFNTYILSISIVCYFDCLDKCERIITRHFIFNADKYVILNDNT